MQSGESFSSRNSTNCSMIASFFKFRKPDCTSSRGYVASQISRELRVPAPRSESDHQRYHFFIEAKLNPAFVFGFAAWTPAQIRESLVKLATALKGRFSSAPGWLRPAGF